MNYVAVIGGKIKPKPLIERAKTLTTSKVSGVENTRVQPEMRRPQNFLRKTDARVLSAAKKDQA
uniref:GG11208 n=1 Tax=Drosophila erecta TaxID=7220 RepID=B3P7C0_DROER